MHSGTFGLEGVGGDAVDATVPPPGFELPAAEEDRRRAAPSPPLVGPRLKTVYAELDLSVPLQLPLRSAPAVS